jgi:hypothetical protein
MMSAATEIIHHPSSEVIQIVAMSESGSEASKAAKKREYNRNAQRVFRKYARRLLPCPCLPESALHQELIQARPTAQGALEQT